MTINRSPVLVVRTATGSALKAENLTSNPSASLKAPPQSSRKFPKSLSDQAQAMKGSTAFGIVMLYCHNDGSDITVENDPPAPDPSDDFHYDQMIRRLGHIYDHVSRPSEAEQWPPGPRPPPGHTRQPRHRRRLLRIGHRTDVGHRRQGRSSALRLMALTSLRRRPDNKTNGRPTPASAPCPRSAVSAHRRRKRLRYGLRDGSGGDVDHGFRYQATAGGPGCCCAGRLGRPDSAAARPRRDGPLRAGGQAGSPGRWPTIPSPRSGMSCAGRGRCGGARPSVRRP